jgi:hypothetical protein
MPRVPALVRSMCGPRRLARLARTLFVAGIVSTWFGAAPGWGQPAGTSAAGVTVGAGGGEASVVAGQVLTGLAEPS